MEDEAIDYSSDVCYDLLNTFRNLDLFEETLSNRVVKSSRSSQIAILHHHGSEAAHEHMMAIIGDDWL